MASPERPLCLLSLDGGGIRGLSELIILKHLTEAINDARGDGQELHPYQLFDMIGGTSTGGIIAIMLGRLHMSLDECENAYLALSKHIFTPRRMGGNLLGRSKDFLNADGKFDAVVLEDEIRKTLRGLPGIDDDELLKEQNPQCKTFVVAARQSNGELALLRSYKNLNRADVLYNECKVWEACRATSAAPTFFDPIKMGRYGQMFVDGGMIYNNPIQLVYREASDIWPNRKILLISIGTGSAPGRSLKGNLKTIVDRMKEIVTETEQTANDFHYEHGDMVQDNLLYRFNVTHGLADVGLEEYKEVGAIADATQTYLDSGETAAKYRACVSKFSEASKVPQRSHPIEGNGWTDILHCMSQISGSGALHNIRQCDASIEEIDQGYMGWFWDSLEYSSWLSTPTSTFLWLYGLPGSGKTLTVTSVVRSFQESSAQSEAKDVISAFFSHSTTELSAIYTLVSQLIPRIRQAYANGNGSELPLLSAKFSGQDDAALARRVPYLREISNEEELVRKLWHLLARLIILYPERQTVIILDGIDAMTGYFRGLFLSSLRDLETNVLGKAVIRILVSSRDFPEIREVLSHYSNIEREKEWKEFLDSLRFDAWNARETKIINAEEGGSWLSANEEYTKWLESPGSDLLWIAGKPGSGKSTLVKLIMKGLRTGSSPARLQGNKAESKDSQYFKTSSDGEPKFANFYYSFRGGHTEMSHELMLRSIAYQIYSQSDRLFNLVRGRFREMKLCQSSWNFQELKLLLQSLSNATFKLKAFIAVDGLDESDNALRDNVLEFFSTLAASKGRSVLKILVASRPENDIKLWMQHAQRILLEQVNHEDIKTIVRTEFLNLQKFRLLMKDPEISYDEALDQENAFSTTEAYIVENSQGVFLWVALILKEVGFLVRQGGYTLEDIDQCIRSLPKDLVGIDGLYTLMVKRLVGQPRKIQNHEARGRRIFAWLTFSERNISFSELKNALAVPLQLPDELQRATFSLTKTMPNDFERGINSLCGGFVEIRTLGEQKSPQLIHQTVREFLLDKSHLAQPYNMDEHFGDMEIAGTCYRCIQLAFMATVTRTEIDRNFSMAEDVVRHLSSWHLLPYALANLATSLRHLGSRGQDFITGCQDFVSRVRQMPSSYSSLLLALWFGSHLWPTQVEISNEEIHTVRDCLDSTLVCAASKGKMSAIDILLILGANPMKALFAIMDQGNMAVIQLLLASREAGAAIDTKGSDGYSLLCKASTAGHAVVVEMLIANGADVHSKTTRNLTPLSFAAQNGHEEVIRVLIDKGADPEHRGFNGMTPLHLAAENNHNSSVKLLLELGVSLDAWNYNGSTPLHTAIQNDNEDMVKLLLDRGADPNVDDNEGLTPLHIAAQKGYEATVRLLIEAGAVINALDREGLTPLHTAVQAGHEAIADLLAEKGPPLHVENQ